MTGTREAREAEFHDHAFSSTAREAASKFYLAAVSAKERYRAAVAAAAAGGRALEVGCGPGEFLLDLAASGSTVDGIDVSEVALERGREAAARAGLSSRVHLHRMNVESMAFPDATFDCVCGSGVLHHLDLQRSIPEIRRLLVPGGRAVFFEPLGHNPLINLYRRLTPQMRSVDEQPLRESDMQSIAGAFETADLSFHCLASLLAVPFRHLPGCGALRRALEAVDGVVLRLPVLRRHAWIVVMELQQSTGC